MAIAFVQAKSNGSDATSASSISVSITVTSGNMVAGIACCSSNSGANDITSISDNGSGGTWVIKRKVTDVTNDQVACSFYGYGWSSPPTSIQANFNNSTPYRGFSVIEFSGQVSGDPLDGTNEQGRQDSSSTTQSGSGTQTPSVDGCVVFGGSTDTANVSAAGGNEFTAGTNFTEPANAEYAVAGAIMTSSEYWIQTTATAANASFTVTNEAHITFQMIFKPSGGGAGGGAKMLAALGVG